MDRSYEHEDKVYHSHTPLSGRSTFDEIKGLEDRINNTTYYHPDGKTINKKRTLEYRKGEFEEAPQKIIIGYVTYEKRFDKKTMKISYVKISEEKS